VGWGKETNGHKLGAGSAMQVMGEEERGKQLVGGRKAHLWKKKKEKKGGGKKKKKILTRRKEWVLTRTTDQKESEAWRSKQPRNARGKRVAKKRKGENQQK